MEIANKYFYKDYWVKNWDGHIMLATFVGYDKKEGKVVLDAGDGENEFRIDANKFDFENYVRD